MPVVDFSGDEILANMRPESLDSARVEDMVREYFNKCDKVLVVLLYRPEDGLRCRQGVKPPLNPTLLQMCEIYIQICSNV